VIRIEAILLDIGGVLWHPKETPLSDNWAAKCGFDQIVYNSAWGSQALVGKISGDGMWENIGKQFGLSPVERIECEKQIGQEFGILSF
jgi:hypothetical protein